MATSFCIDLVSTNHTHSIPIDLTVGHYLKLIEILEASRHHITKCLHRYQSKKREKNSPCIQNPIFH